jgi:hypothetical protein
MKCLLVSGIQTINVCHQFKGKMDMSACVKLTISIGMIGILPGFLFELIILIPIFFW